MPYRRIDWAFAFLLALELSSFTYCLSWPLVETLRDYYVGSSRTLVVSQLAVHFALGVLAIFFLSSGRRGVAWAVVLYVTVVAALEPAWIPDPNNPTILAEIEALKNASIPDSAPEVPLISYPFTLSYLLWAVTATYVVFLRPRWLARSPAA